jgi:hypothetical protein
VTKETDQEQKEMKKLIRSEKVKEKIVRSEKK